MEKKDILKKYLAYNGSVRVFLLDGTQMVSKARDIHLLSNVATAALGRTLLATTLIASRLKGEKQRVTVQIKGNGPIGGIVTCGNASLQVKGYTYVPDIELPLNERGKLDVAGAVGQGYLNVIKDLGMKEPYVGMSELISGELAEDFAYYFVTSEQTPCVVSLGVNIAKENVVQRACGYLIEPLPDCEASIIEILEQINQNLNSVTNLMIDLDDMDDVAKTITGDNNIVAIEERYPSYQCDCNTDRIERTIISLGKEDALTIAHQNNGFLEVSCDFCNTVYHYTTKQIELLFEE